MSKTNQAEETKDVDSVIARDQAASTSEAGSAGTRNGGALLSLATDFGNEAAAAACCHHKDTPRSAEFQADLQKRLNRAIGQLNGVKGMLDDNRYCGDVLVQLAAAESAIRSVSGKLLQDHLETCVVEQIRQGNDEVVGEVMQLMKRFSRL